MSIYNLSPIGGVTFSLRLNEHKADVIGVENIPTDMRNPYLFNGLFVRLSDDTAVIRVFNGINKPPLVNVFNEARDEIARYFDKVNLRQKIREHYLIQKLLDHLGSPTIELSYSGSGDSGQIDDCSVDDEEVIDFLDSIVTDLHSGYENNEGGYGTITWDLVRDIITIDHNDAEVIYNNTTTEV